MQNNIQLPFEVSRSAPFYFNLAKWLQRNNLKGGYRLERMGQERGWAKNKIVSYPISSKIEIAVPIEARGLYDPKDIQSYEKECVELISNTLKDVKQPITLFDCGADLGLISARLVNELPSISQVYAFEPNSEVFDYLNWTMQNLPVQAEAIESAVSNYNGQASLVIPEGLSEHGAHIAPNDSGNIRVTTIDSIDVENPSVVLMKVDVEGEELTVIQGAVQTLSNCENFVVLFEAHPSQSARSGVDPIKVVQLLNSIKQCSVNIAELPDQVLNTDELFWDQVSTKQILNICVSSLG